MQGRLSAAQWHRVPPAPRLASLAVQRRFTRLSAVATERDSAHVTSFGFAQDFNDKFFVGEHLGTGGFGSVFIAVDKVTHERFAVKSIRKRKVGNLLEPMFVRRVRHEVDVYNHLGRSLNVAYLYGAYEDDEAVDLVMVLCTGGDLFRRIRGGHYTEVDAARVMCEVLRTIAQCHAKDIVVRDVKPDNFLFLDSSPGSPLKAIDFGMATWCRRDDQLSDRAGTPIYVSPDVLKRSYGHKTDLWSAGILAYQLLTGRLPFEDPDTGEFLLSDLYLSKHSFTNKDVFAAILYAPLDFTRPPWNTISAAGREFVMSLLIRDPALRPTAVEALQHPWIVGAADSPLQPPAAGGDLGYAADSIASLTLAESRLLSPNAVPPSYSSDSEEGFSRYVSPSLSSWDDDGQDASQLPLLDTLVQRLQRFGTYGKLKQLSLRAVAYFIPVDHAAVAPLRAAFRELDPEDSGQVPYTALVGMLSSGEFDLSAVEVQQLLAPFDKDMDGQVTYVEWLAALADWRRVQHGSEWDGWVDQVFEQFDGAGSGHLSIVELENVLCNNGMCPIADTVHAAMRSADVDHDNVISQDEFRTYLRTSPHDRLELFESRRTRRRAPALVE